MGDYIQNMQRPNLSDEIIQVDSTVMLRTFLSSSARKAVLFSIILSLAMSHCIAEELEAIAYTLNEQILMIPLGTSWTSPQLETTIFKPPGLGPFPLVVINHGKASGNPRFDPRARFVVASREFLKRGYLVAIPMRPGFSNSTGTDISPGCNAESYGFLQGQAVSDVLTQLSKRPDVDPTRILVIGQSTGGLTTIAFSTTTFPGVKGVINFAGGVKNPNCQWEGSLVNAFSSYGKKSQMASLWFYGDNDSYWGPDLPKKMHEAFTIAGGHAQLVSYGNFPYGDAHGMFSSEKGTPIWWPETEKFLSALGLPTAVKYVVEKTPVPPKSNFAAVDDVQAVPILDDRRRERYKQFLKLPHPRAFAIAQHGNVGWSSGGFDPIASALSACEGIAKETCSLYAVDDIVVWPKGMMAK